MQLKFPKWIQKVIGFKYYRRGYGFFNLLPNIDIQNKFFINGGQK